MTNTQTDIAGEIFAYKAMFPDHEHDHIDPFLAYKSVSDPDTLYYHQARNLIETNSNQEWKRRSKTDLKTVTSQ